MKHVGLVKRVCIAVVLISATAAQAGFIPENRPRFATITLYVATEGRTPGDGSHDAPFTSIKEAQKAVRAASDHANVIVMLAEGVYRQTEPLQFRAADGGQNGTTVTWQDCRPQAVHAAAGLG